MQQSASSLFDRVGGKDAITATVLKLYEKLLSDELLSPFFDGVDMARLRASQTAFVSMALGGPHQYTGEHLRKAHERLVARGLSDVHFDAVAMHLAAAMRELGVAETMISEALTVVETTRNDVLNR